MTVKGSDCNSAMKKSLNNSQTADNFIVTVLFVH